MGKPSPTGQPTRPTQPFILPGSINEQQVCLWDVAPSGECWRGKGPPDRMLANLVAVCFWQPIPSGQNLIAAVLRDSLCVVSLLPRVADCCMLYTVCKVEQFVLTIIERRLLLLLVTELHIITSHTFYKPSTRLVKTQPALFGIELFEYRVSDTALVTRRYSQGFDCRILRYTQHGITGVYPSV